MKKMYSPRDFRQKPRKKYCHCFIKKYKNFFVSFLTYFKRKKTHLKPSDEPVYIPSKNMTLKKRPLKKKKTSNITTQKWWRKWLLLVLKIGVIFFAIGLLSTIGMFAYLAKDLPEPGKVNTRTIDESTKIYDRTGTIILYDIHGEEKRTIIPHAEIPLVVKQATISLEDHNFYNHPGFDINGVINAVLSNIFNIGGGRGGSTITQQFVKNSILTNERSLTRKIKELILAIEIELKFSKDDILGMYLNEIPYGSNTYGIEAAAQTFFDKHAKDLTLDEATILASLPKAPSRYSPYGSNSERLKIRQEYALDQMASLGYISEEASNSAKTEDVFVKLAKNTENIKAPHFVMYVREFLEEKYGNEYLEKEGLKVITTLDWDKQQIGERIVREQAFINKEKYNAENSALVAIDPATGDIITMVGSRNYFDEDIDGQVNVAIRDRQPGSSFKPYAYIYAFKKGYTPETILYDVETKFSNGDNDYIPQNYDGTFRGPTKMKEALGMSLNIPAVKTLYLANPQEVITFTKQLGITSLNDPKRYGLSLVLGGGEVKLLDHTAAFGVFANNGLKHDKRSILKITAKNGDIIEEAHNSEGEKIIEEKYVGMLSHILSTNKYRTPTFGENNPLKFNDRPVAAKTGTTNENRDAWTIGYTPDIAVGIWSGNNDNSSMNSHGVGANASGPIFRDFIREAYPEPSGKEFPKYDKDANKTGKDILDGKKPDLEKIKVCEIPENDDEYCKANKYCPDNKHKKRIFADIHNILHYVTKNDPQGDEPKKPKADPQYKNWENGLRKYYKEEKDDKIIFDEEPDDCKKDDFKKYTAKVSLSVPSSVDKDYVEIKVSPDTEYDIDKIEYFVEGKKIKETKDASHVYKIPESQNNKTITIEVRLKDTSSNTASAKKDVAVSYQ